jgi:hypothetical protein
MPPPLDRPGTRKTTQRHSLRTLALNSCPMLCPSLVSLAVYKSLSLSPSLSLSLSLRACVLFMYSYVYATCIRKHSPRRNSKR